MAVLSRRDPGLWPAVRPGGRGRGVLYLGGDLWGACSTIRVRI